MPQEWSLGDTSATDESVVQGLGHALGAERLRQNRSQREVAQEAGVSRATLQRLEGGESVQLTSLVGVLRALGLRARLAGLVPAPGPSPMEELEREARTRPRQRASGPRQVDERSEADGAWRWGEDA